VKREGFASNERMNLLDNQTQRYGIDTDAAVKREGYDVQRELAYLDSNTKLQIQNMSSSTQLAVTRMGKEYDLQLQASENARTIFQQMATNITNIDQSNLSVEGKRNAIQRQMAITQDALNVMGDVGSIPNMASYYYGNYA
jgi:hypothetical protein